MDANKIAIRGTTQEHLDIEDIKDDLVILKDGSCCLIVATTAINFDLLSEREQDATIYAYAGLLNSLTFAIQILIRSQRKDISSYLHLLEEAEQKETKKEIKTQIQKYRQFVQEIVQKNEVLDKKAYIIILMSALELGIAKTLTASFRSRKKLPFDKAYILEKAKLNLYPKRDHILRLLARLGLRGRQLTNQELIQFFFTIYNPESTGHQLLGGEQYQTPLVQPALSHPPAVRLSSPSKSGEAGEADEASPVPDEAKYSPVPDEAGPPNSQPASVSPSAPTVFPSEKSVILKSASNSEKTIQDEISNMVKEEVNENNSN